MHRVQEPMNAKSHIRTRYPHAERWRVGPESCRRSDRARYLDGIAERTDGIVVSRHLQCKDEVADRKSHAGDKPKRSSHYSADEQEGDMAAVRVSAFMRDHR